MSPIVILLVLSAAILHATWNAVLRSGNDHLWTVTIMSLATSAAVLPLALILPLPLIGAWPYLIVSALLQVGYSVFLAFAYRHGGLSQVYPIVRGCVPVIVTCASFILAGQRLSASLIIGVALVSVGITSLALGRGHAAPKSVAFALLTSVFIASYVTADGIGVRLAGGARAYVVWIFLLYGAVMPLAFRTLRGHFAAGVFSRDGLRAMAGGVVSMISYTAMTSALALGPIGPISALRETSIVFSVLIGRLFLKETLTWRRMVVVVTVTMGAIVIGYTA